MTKEQAAALMNVCVSGLADSPLLGFAWGYEGTPEYYYGPYEGAVTVLAVNVGGVSVPDGYVLAAEYVCGERDCPWCGAGNESERDNCQLCEGDGLIFWGEETRECVLIPRWTVVEDGERELATFTSHFEALAYAVDDIRAWQPETVEEHGCSEVWLLDGSRRLAIVDRADENGRYVDYGNV